MTYKPTDAELDALRQADNGELNFVTLRQFRVIARAALAKWGSPVVAGEPWGASVGDRVWVGKLPTHVPKLAEEEGLPIQWLYTTPQPAQAQAGAVPLTDNELVRLSRVGAIQTDDSGKVMLWPASYKTQMEDRFKSGWREAEKHHGITKEGGQP